MELSPQKLFHHAVEHIFSNWKAFQITLNYGMGGAGAKAKAEWFMEVTEKFFYENKDVYPDEVSDFMDEILNNEFDTICEDNSSYDAAASLCNYFNKCKKGELEQVFNELGGLPRCDLSNDKAQDNELDSKQENPNQITKDSVQNDSGIASDEVEETMDVDEEDDGWRTVKKGKVKKR